jgi:hypothetical protein
VGVEAERRLAVREAPRDLRANTYEPLAMRQRLPEQRRVATRPSFGPSGNALLIAVP